MRDTSETIDLFNKAFLLDFCKQTWVSLKQCNQGSSFMAFHMLMKKKCDAEVNCRTMGGQSFGLAGRSQDELVPCTGAGKCPILIFFP